MLGAALRQCSIVDRPRRGEAAWAFQPARETPMIFMSFCRACLYWCGRVAALRHHRPAHLQHARRPAVAEDFDRERASRPDLRASTTARGGDVVDRHQQIGGELHFRAVAELADVVMAARKAVQDRNCFLEGGIFFFFLHHQISGARLRAGAAQGTVEQRDAGLGEPLARRRLGRDRQGAGFNDDPAFVFFAANFPCNPGKRLR